MTVEIFDDPAMSADPGLVHLSSQIVQLLWLENSPSASIRRFGGGTRTRLLERAGKLLKQLAQHVAAREEVPGSEYGALPSPAALETSSCLLEALREAGLRASPMITDTMVGDERYDQVRDKLLQGDLPSVAAREKLMEVFSALAEVAARREYRSPLHDSY